MTEWVSVPGFAGYAVNARGQVMSHRSGRLLTPGGARYDGVEMTTDDGGRRRVLVHRLVCEAFNGPAPSVEHVVRHLDGDARNNNADNLAWGTTKENHADARRHGTWTHGTRVCGSKLDETRVREIRTAYAQGESRLSLAERFGVSRTSIGYIVRRIHWAWLDAA